MVAMESVLRVDIATDMVVVIWDTATRTRKCVWVCVVLWAIVRWRTMTRTSESVEVVDAEILWVATANV
jgi:hypothetical protein